MAELSQASHRLRVRTRGKGFIDITEDLRHWLGDISARDGLLTVFVCHTSASLTIQENADPNVRRDLMTTLETLAPEDALYLGKMLPFSQWRPERSRAFLVRSNSGSTFRAA